MRRRHRGEPCAADATAAAATEELRVAIEDVRAATEDLRAATDDLRAAVEVSRGVAAAAVRAAAPPNAGGNQAACWALLGLAGRPCCLFFSFCKLFIC